jgi:hypothetical protein
VEAQEDLAAVAADSSDQVAQAGALRLLQDLLLCIISNRDLNFSKHPLKLQDLVVVAA